MIGRFRKKIQFDTLIVFCLIFVHTLLLGYNAIWMSPTLDEPAHLVAGMSHWKHGDFSLYRVNPPLIRAIAVVPVLLSGYDVELGDMANHEFGRPEFGLGEAFATKQGRDVFWITTIARWICIPFSWLGAWICYRWSKELFGAASGIAACTLWCFAPMVIGHAALMTPDAHATSLGLAACYTFWKWLKRPTWRLTIVTGFVLGIAELSKTTLILFYPLWPILWIMYRLMEQRSPNLDLQPHSKSRRFPQPTSADDEVRSTNSNPNKSEPIALATGIESTAISQLAQATNPSDPRRPEGLSGQLEDAPSSDSSSQSTPTSTRPGWLSEFSMLVVRMLIGIYVINLGYLGVGSFMPLKEYPFVSELFGGRVEPHLTHKDVGWRERNSFKGTWLGNIPVPLPFDYVLGMDYQQRDFENFGRPSYLRGVFQDKGWWYYYFYAVLVKAPLGTLGLIVFTFIVRFILARRVIPLRDELLVLIPAIFVFAVVSSKTGFSHHLRYIFPCIPFVFIWISQLWHPRSSFAPRTKRFFGVVSILATLLLTYTTLSSLSYFPHNFAYFNEVASGPKGGPKHLINSNIDWGQDLLHLEAWIKENGGDKTVYLAYDNYVNPFAFGINGVEPWPIRRPSKQEKISDENPIPEIPDGYYAISINQLYEFPWALRDRTNQFYYLDLRPLQNLRALEPVSRAGYSIYVYSSEQLRNAYDLPTS